MAIKCPVIKNFASKIFCGSLLMLFLSLFYGVAQNVFALGFFASLNSSCTIFTSLRSVKIGCASVKKRINSFVLLSAFTIFSNRWLKKIGCTSA